MDIIYKNNFITAELIHTATTDKINEHLKFENKFVDPNGVFQSQNTSNQLWLKLDSKFVTDFDKMLQNTQEFVGHSIDGIQILHSFLPFDVHSDWIVQNNRIPLCDPKTNPPSYTLIAPLVSDFSTIVFDQEGEYNRFEDYKRSNNKVENRISDDIWNQYLKHCHNEDRDYLSIKKIFEWKVGDLFAFHRKFFHSAGYFTTHKQAIVAWLSKK